MHRAQVYLIVGYAIGWFLYIYDPLRELSRKVDPEIFSLSFRSVIDIARMDKYFKVFVYPHDFESQCCNQSMEFNKQYFTSEMQFYNNIRDSQLVTDNPDEANMYFIPFGCDQRQNELTSYCKPSGESVLVSFKSLIHKYPYWRKKSGADHFWVTCEDMGEIRPEILTELSSLTKKSIRVYSYSNPLILNGPSLNVIIPELALPLASPEIKRESLVFTPRYHLFNIRDVEDLKLKEDRDRYLHKLNVFKFCTCPTDDSRDFGSMLADTIHFGCVPVIFYDRYALPFDDILKWRNFAVMFKVDSAIPPEAFSDANYTVLSGNVMKVQKHLQWNSSPVQLDAFHLTMFELWKKRSTSTMEQLISLLFFS